MSNGGTPHNPAHASFPAMTQPGNEGLGAYASFPPDIPTDVPTSARVYGLALGSKDNFQVDRLLALRTAEHFPEIVDVARENRRFLYRAVRYLAEEAGICQFLDLGSGLPTQNNVHEVAQRFQPQARVVYVDNDPIVLAHGRALLGDTDQTTVITADMTEPDSVLGHADTRRLIDFDEPLAVLLFSIPHCIPDDAAVRRAIQQGPLTHAAPGSYLAISHIVANDEATRTETSELISNLGMPWKTRSPRAVDAWVAEAGLEPVEPGLCDINDWRPDPTQPRLAPAHPVVQPFVGASQHRKRVYEYGGVLSLPQEPALASTAGGGA